MSLLRRTQREVRLSDQKQGQQLRSNSHLSLHLQDLVHHHHLVPEEI